MLTLISRAVGVVVILVLAAIGAETLCKRLLSWKRAFDQATSGGAVRAA